MKMRRAMALVLALALLCGCGVALGEAEDALVCETELEESQAQVVGEDGLLADLAPATDETLADAVPEPTEDGLLAASGEADAAEANGMVPPGTEQYFSNGGALDNDALFAAYVDQLFGVEDGAACNAIVGEALTGMAKDCYDYLLSQIKRVAAGEITDTRFAIPLSIVPLESLSEGIEVVFTAMNALWADCPYEMFWRDRSWSYAYDANGLRVNMPVDAAYGVDTYTPKASELQRAQTAAQNARNVVREYAKLSDYEKLRAYLHWICEATEYNYDAAEAMQGYGTMNPWEAVWAFDDDPATTIVCEGYSKAFQYLCELSAFNGNIQCYCVTGMFYDDDGSGGGHMWNTVHMGDGKNYLVDVTHCDQGDFADEDVFLKGYYAKQSESAYNFAHYIRIYGYSEEPMIVDTSIVTYVYSSDTMNIYPARALALSGKDYDTAFLSVAPTSVTLSPSGTQQLQKGKTLALTAKLAPDGAESRLTWKSTKPAVATVSDQGVVTGVKAGTAVIQVSTANGLTDTVKVQVYAPKATGVSITQGKSATLYMGNKLTLKAKLAPKGATSALKWKSSKPDIATVSAKGVVTPKQAGTAKISVAIDNGKVATITVRVVDAKSVKLAEGKSATLKVGKKLTLHATIAPGQVKRKLTWLSGNKRVATVSTKGVVTAKKPGKAKITVSTPNGKSATITITVSKN